MNIDSISSIFEGFTKEELAVIAVVSLMVLLKVVWPAVKHVCKALIVYDLVNRK